MNPYVGFAEAAGGSLIFVAVLQAALRAVSAHSAIGGAAVALALVAAAEGMHAPHVFFEVRRGGVALQLLNALSHVLGCGAAGAALGHFGLF